MRYPLWFDWFVALLFLSIGITAAHAAYPSDPTANTEWPFSAENTVADVQTRFNVARTNENTQLGTTIPPLVMPTQSAWDGLSDGEKALWLINRERIDRGVAPLHGLESHVMGVAQYYADYLLTNNEFSHDADGRDPWERLHDNAAIGACYDYLQVAENIAAFWASGTSWTLPIERAVFNWMYDDSGSTWGHRHAILWFSYNENSGPTDREGFLGIGHTFGEHNGYPSSDIIVMNVFDPCATWDYTTGAETWKVIAPILHLLLDD